MIKIEKISPNIRATIERSGAGKVTVYVGMLLSKAEFETLKFDIGSITYSIDELEVVTITKDTSNEPVVENPAIPSTINTVPDVTAVGNSSTNTDSASATTTTSNPVPATKAPIKKAAKSTAGKTVK